MSKRHDPAALQNGRWIAAAVRITTDVCLDDPEGLGFAISRLDSRTQSAVLAGFVDGLSQLGDVGRAFQIASIAEGMRLEDDSRDIPVILRELTDAVTSEFSERVARAMGSFANDV